MRDHYVKHYARLWQVQATKSAATRNWTASGIYIRKSLSLITITNLQSCVVA
jgi:hypothetical protein